MALAFAAAPHAVLAQSAAPVKISIAAQPLDKALLQSGQTPAAGLFLPGSGARPEGARCPGSLTAQQALDRLLAGSRPGGPHRRQHRRHRARARRNRDAVRRAGVRRRPRRSRRGPGRAPQPHRHQDRHAAQRDSSDHQRGHRAAAGDDRRDRHIKRAALHPGFSSYGSENARTGIRCCAVSPPRPHGRAAGAQDPEPGQLARRALHHRQHHGAARPTSVLYGQGDPGAIVDAASWPTATASARSRSASATTRASSWRSTSATPPTATASLSYRLIGVGRDGTTDRPQQGRPHRLPPCRCAGSPARRRR